MNPSNESKESNPGTPGMPAASNRQERQDYWKQFLENQGKSASSEDLVELLNELDALRDRP